jgi:hypothetical protein
VTVSWPHVGADHGKKVGPGARLITNG